MPELSDIFEQYEQAYLQLFGDNIPKSHLKAIYNIINCRKPNMGGIVRFCDNCQKFHYSYHSCGNRNCNKCQYDLTDKWIDKNSQRLLPVNHFLVTFTLPGKLRKYARENQRLFYSLLLKMGAEALQKLADDPKFVGGKLGMMAILHTWARNMAYHPHGHFVVSGGGLFEDEKLWLPANDDYLVNVIALSIIFRAKFRDALKKQAPDVFRLIPSKVWRDDWVVNCKAVGNGQTTIKYLATYVFRPAISNNRILKLKDGNVTFKFEDSNTKQWKTMTLPVLKFMARYLQHVLPKGFVKVRYYGLYSFRQSETVAYLKDMLADSKKLSVKQEINRKQKLKIITCPDCGSILRRIRDVKRGEQWSMAPPVMALI